jgi:hypothetical protein
VAQPLPAVFRDIVVTIVPEASPLDELGWQHLESLVQGMLDLRPPSMARQIRLFLKLIEWLPVARYGKPFTALEPARRTRVLTYLQDHPVELLRVGFWGLRTLALLGYYGRPEGAQAIGYAADARGWEAYK